MSIPFVVKTPLGNKEIHINIKNVNIIDNIHIMRQMRDDSLEMPFQRIISFDFGHTGKSGNPFTHSFVIPVAQMANIVSIVGDVIWHKVIKFSRGKINNQVGVDVR